MDEDFDSEEIQSHVKNTVYAVLKAEKEKLYMKTPRGILDDIETIVKNTIKE